MELEMGSGRFLIKKKENDLINKHCAKTRENKLKYFRDSSFFDVHILLFYIKTVSHINWVILYFSTYFHIKYKLKISHFSKLFQ